MDAERKKAWEALRKKSMEQAKEYEAERLRKLRELERRKKEEAKREKRKRIITNAKTWLTRIFYVLIALAVCSVWAYFDTRCIPVLCISFIPPILLCLFFYLYFKNKKSLDWEGVGCVGMMIFFIPYWILLFLLLGILRLYF